MRIKTLMLIALLLVWSASSVLSVGLPAGTTLEIVARAEYMDNYGQALSSDPAVAILTVGQNPSVSIVNEGIPADATKSSACYIPIKILNQGNAPDAFAVTSKSKSGRSTCIIYDNNDDGIHQTSESSVITGTGNIITDGYAPCFVKVDMPAGSSTGDVVTVSAISGYDAAKASASINLDIPADSPISVNITSPSTSSTFTINTPSITLAGNATDDETISTVKWTNDKGGSGIATGTNSWQINDIALKPGQNLITVNAETASGNKGSDTITVNFSDTTAPSINITSPTCEDTYVTSNSSFQIGGNASDQSKVESVKWSNNRGGSGDCTGTTNWSVSNITLLSGENIITVTAKDDSGNESIDTLKVNMDDTNPVVTITSPTTEDTYQPTTQKLNISGTAEDTTGIASVSWTNSTGGSGNCTGTTSWSIADIAILPGENIITVTVKDTAGNESTDTLTVNFDGTSPEVAITSPTTSEKYLTRFTTINLSGTASDNKNVASVSWSNDRGGGGDCTGTTSWSVSNLVLQQGVNVITIQAKDDCGNIGKKQLTVTLDTTPPEITITKPTTLDSCARNLNSLFIAGFATDAGEIESVTWSASNGQSDYCSGTNSWNASDIALDLGVNTITVTAKDRAGNTSTDIIRIEYVESLPGDVWNGLTMASLPIIPDESDPKTVVNFYGNGWISFNTDSNSYSVYPETATWFLPANETPGRGFWAQFGNEAPSPYGTLVTQDQPYTMHLKKGWNLVGQPFVNPVCWNIDTLMVKQTGSSAMSMRDNPQLVMNYAWGWQQDIENPQTGQYQIICDKNILPDAEDQLEPWKGYWVRAYAECDLIIPAP